MKNLFNYNLNLNFYSNTFFIVKKEKIRKWLSK